MQATEIIITREQFNQSPKNTYGIFNPPADLVRQYQMTYPLTEEQLDQLFELYWTSAFDAIDAFNKARPLGAVQLIDLSPETLTILTNAIILQVADFLQNGLVEIRNENSLSTSSFSVNTTNTTRIIPSDDIGDAVEKELNKIQYMKWYFQWDEETQEYYLVIGEQTKLIPSFMNNVALSSIVWEGLDNNDRIALGKNAIIYLIGQETSKAKAFLGTYDGLTIAGLSNILQTFNTTGLTLTNGSLVTPATVKMGDTILIVASQENGVLPEEVLWDGTKWYLITNNNSANSLIVALRNDIIRLGNEKVNIADLPDFARFALTTQLNAINNNLQTQITVNKNNFDRQSQTIAFNTTGVQDYYNNKANFALLSDISEVINIFTPAISFIRVTAGTTTPDANGTEIIATYALTPANLAKLQIGDKVKALIRKNDNTAQKFIEDTFNDGAFTDGVFAGTAIQWRINATETRVKGLTTQQITDIVTNYKLIELAKVGTVGSSADQEARTRAQQALDQALQAFLLAQRAMELPQGNISNGDVYGIKQGTLEAPLTDQVLNNHEIIITTPVPMALPFPLSWTSSDPAHSTGWTAAGTSHQFTAFGQVHTLPNSDTITLVDSTHIKITFNEIANGNHTEQYYKDHITLTIPVIVKSFANITELLAKKLSAPTTDGTFLVNKAGDVVSFTPYVAPTPTSLGLVEQQLVFVKNDNTETTLTIWKKA